MSVNEAKGKFEAAKKSLASCQTSIAELQRKSDTLQESLPGLSREVENAEKAKTSALENFAMASNKTTELALKMARQNCDDASKKLAETNELVEATNRALKKMESELPKLHTQADLQKRQCWESIADEIHLKIPEDVISDIQRLVVASTQCSKTKQYILNELFPNLNPSEYQTRRDELIEKYGIAD